MHTRGPHFVFAILRIYTGIFWLVHGIPKFLNSDAFMPPQGFMAQMVLKGTQTTTGSYHDFLVSFVTPNIALFAEFVRLGEVLVGFSLLFGLLTRVGGLGGIFLALNYIAAKGAFGSWETFGTLDAAAIALSALHVVLPTGRTLGVDGLFGHRPRVVREPAVTPEFVDEPPLAPAENVTSSHDS